MIEPQDLLERFTSTIKQAAKIFLAIAGVKKYRDQLISKIKHKNTLTPKQENIIEICRKNNIERNKIFDSFYQSYITGIFHSTYREALTSNKSRWEKYNYVIAGSDQIWNQDIVGTWEALRFYYLYFVESSKRINYASSFGWCRRNSYIHKKGLNGFNKLSCREESGCDFIKKLTGRDAELVLDPTLLLNADEWRKIARKPDYDLPERYALKYFFFTSESHQQVINQFAKNEKLEIIDIFDRKNKLHYCTGPQEFLYLVDHAEIILTGSFHGTAFSINFGKKFISFGENDTRIKSILSQLGIMNRLYCEGHDIPSGEINYQEVNAKLDSMRESSLKYLRDCLNV